MKVFTTCPFCGCGCGVALEVEKGRVIAAFPQRAHPVSRGTLCIKGWNGHQIVHNDARLTIPRIKENGKFKTVSWDHALKFTAKKFKDIKSKHGAESIAVVGSIKCTNEENYLLNKFARVVLNTPHIDTSAQFYHIPSAIALPGGAATGSILDLERTEAVLVLGANAKGQTSCAGSFLLQRVQKGVRAIMIDPREQDHTRFMNLHLSVKPGTDQVLINAMMHVIIDRDWFDPDVKGLGELKKTVARYTPTEAERISGVPSGDIVRAAELFATAKTGMILYGTGITQQMNSIAAIQSLVNLAILTGNLMKEGAGILPLMSSNNMQGAMDMGLSPRFLPGHVAVDNDKARRELEKIWQCKLPAKTGLTLQEMINGAGESIRALYIVGENLAWSAPNSNRCLEALKKLDFLVVQDLFLTETAQLADVVLPAATFAEKDGTYTNTERRIQRIRQAIKPIGRSRNDAEIIQDLAGELGAKLRYASSQEIFAEISSVIPQYAGITYESLDRVGGVQCGKNAVAMNGVKSSIVKVTPPAKRPGELPDDEYPFTLIVGRPNIHKITGTQNLRSFTLKKEDPVGIVEINTDDARTLKVRSGWRLKVKTRRGEVVRTAVVTRSVPPGTLFVPIHHENGMTQSLVDSEIDPLSKIPNMKVCAANLEMV